MPAPTPLRIRTVKLMSLSGLPSETLPRRWRAVEMAKLRFIPGTPCAMKVRQFRAKLRGFIVSDDAQGRDFNDWFQAARRLGVETKAVEIRFAKLEDVPEVDLVLVAASAGAWRPCLGARAASRRCIGWPRLPRVSGQYSIGALIGKHDPVPIPSSSRKNLHAAQVQGWWPDGRRSKPSLMMRCRTT